MARYRFLTAWLLDAPVEPVWDAVYDTNAWPSWWPGVRRVDELVARGEDGIGGVSRFTFRSVLPYDLVFEMRSLRVERPRLLEGIASGELAGVGRWRFFADDGVTAAVYEWNVETTARWMNVLAPLGGPAFAWNHDRRVLSGVTPATRPGARSAGGDEPLRVIGGGVQAGCGRKRPHESRDVLDPRDRGGGETAGTLLRCASSLPEGPASSAPTSYAGWPGTAPTLRFSTS